MAKPKWFHLFSFQNCNFMLGFEVKFWFDGVQFHGIYALDITVKDWQKITLNVLGEHKVITIEKQFLGVILSYFLHLTLNDAGFLVS